MSQQVGAGGGVHSDLGVLIIRQHGCSQHSAGAYAMIHQARLMPPLHPLGSPGGKANHPSSQVRRLKLRVAKCLAGGAGP